MNETYTLLRLFENLSTVGPDIQSPLLAQEILTCEKRLQKTLLPLIVPWPEETRLEQKGKGVVIAHISDYLALQSDLDTCPDFLHGAPSIWNTCLTFSGELWAIGRLGLYNTIARMQQLEHFPPLRPKKVADIPIHPLIDCELLRRVATRRSSSRWGLISEPTLS
ncbi:TPA: hypothetical protein DEP34_03470 [Candidatus Uhrbacteria bacterium]|uniref:Uncharacterized protein n=2 Tax=Candidatus Uhriibacteriota TaxID=1752732 RepID=A0A0G1SGS0_9BACT|nr:MAG: hypothetical protein UX45_C0009G0006 [Candidatus Uhrbacteria bacterium GW2011_GWF2_46_218]KKU41303.1 MAG: hypothetical protein UX57_C0004G0007 [Candidatus Uhrbacteria bacterium GW2011_GWE2_46_68]HBK33741.1 hypothetical protein [Candidatus Uhrbacteria bacterium]HCB19418.1 hypothetical protein [Candidatus Uhrbacteria bacterium]